MSNAQPRTANMIINQPLAHELYQQHLALLHALCTSKDPNAVRREVDASTALLDTIKDSNKERLDNQHYANAAKEHYHVDGEVEVDPTASVSISEKGAYVQAWVWINESDAVS
jgi:hypothetical protein